MEQVADYKSLIYLRVVSFKKRIRITKFPIISYEKLPYRNCTILHDA